MNRKFVEKLIILIVVFLIVTIATGAIIGNYVSKKKELENKKNSSLILENINLI